MKASTRLAVADKDRSFPDIESVAMSLQPSYPVYCVRPRILERAAKQFISSFPGTVLYAVKCNPHPLVLDALHRGGIRHFDTASLPEIAQICESYGDATAYFMHPVKARAVIKSAYAVYGVRHFVVDHLGELDKIEQEADGKDLVIVVRVATPPAEGTLVHLADKFGAPPEEAVALLREAARRGFQVGAAFHVGSQCGDPKAYYGAIKLLGETIETAGVDPACIDVGGGFPANYVNARVPPIDDYMKQIQKGLKEIALKPTAEVYAEPGRALTASGCSLLAQIQLRKGRKLYLNDGIYGSLSEINQVGVELPCRLIRLGGGASSATAEFSINGPTCDSLDVVPTPFHLPEDADEGDWIEIDYMGAYSNALATRFNGFNSETFVEVYDDPPAERP